MFVYRKHVLVVLENKLSFSATSCLISKLNALSARICKLQHKL